MKHRVIKIFVFMACTLLSEFEFSNKVKKIDIIKPTNNLVDEKVTISGWGMNHVSNIMTMQQQKIYFLIRLFRISQLFQICFLFNNTATKKCFFSLGRSNARKIARKY